MTPSTPDEPVLKLVRCPTCGGDSLYAPSNRYRPFCSERCKKIDLGAWASEQFTLPASAPPDDAQVPPSTTPKNI
ncbi:MAG: DNA gyrase inhibitor YacG [Rhodoferax sp.]|nr:DNA gyrase inhibitor YacG [Betaproteobacteria bacterium]NCN97347.1 DNA gyrase inhibitor YacG [Rhodoferax sp.]OIP14175.1 MAG: DNA gyrase inhibitor YacG [Comamonadaceae bacterium CG2_30_57_122]PIZ23057.1 MAG: DNA gyrase inhibitor YacG [Comamonadaceae bacterium CG_4_10_14_0_8_um_filter_57_29]PJC14468.1 MAG: DNA gyrase inhibitor YacG [Comamonadaceae bacterium CG_4_9_14_0_8_um_filter_57_21]